MRIDLLLFRLRLSRSRTQAQALVDAAHIRLNGQRVTRRDQAVKPGDILTLPRGGGVQVIELVALPQRRGPPAEARDCYRTLDAGASFAIADNKLPERAARIEGKSLT